MAKPNFILPNKPAIKAGSILSYNYTDDLKFAAEPLDFSRNSSATRVNEQGLIEEVGYFGPQLVQNGDFSQEGSELITNGDFATDSDWNLRSSWVISNGNCSLTPPNSDYLSQSNVLTSNKSYKLTFDIIVNSGNLQPQFFDGGFQTIGTYNTTQTVEVYFKPTSSGTLYFKPNLFDGSIDNVSVKEVGQDWSFGSGWSMGDGVVEANNTSSFISQSGLIQASKLYRLTFKARLKSGTNGTINAYIGGSNNQQFTIDSTNWQSFTYVNTRGGSTSDSIYFNNNGTELELDNISVVEVLGDKPRIDYSDSSTEPSLLLEPQSTNLITQSENFSSVDWTKTLVTASANDAASPSGEVNASLIQETVYTSSIPSLRITNNIPISAGKHTLSFYVKNNSGRYLGISFGNNTNRIRTTFDFDTETFKTPLFNGITEGEVSYTTIGDYYRILITANFTSGLAALVYIMPLATDSYPFFEFQNSDNRSFYLWGAQVEASSYATSYIPTSGSTATRLGETANNAGGAGVFNSEEGVLYAEIASLTDFSGSISINDGTVSNRIELGFTSLSRAIIYMEVGGVLQVYERPAVSDITSFYKIAFKWKLNDFSLHINGNKVAASSNGVTPSANTFNNLSFNGFYSNNFFGKTKNIQVFNYALTDEELQTLTT